MHSPIRLTWHIPKYRNAKQTRAVPKHNGGCEYNNKMDAWDIHSEDPN
jgi:hypothetical protein